MKLAYLIAAHTDPIQLFKLINALDSNIANVTFFIHIDKKVDITSFINILNNKQNVIFIKQRIDTQWGAFSQCKYQIKLIKACIESNIHFDRVFFLSGLDYPLWSNEKIIDFLKKNTNKEFIMGMNLTQCTSPNKMQTRVRLYHFRDLPIKHHLLYRIVYCTIKELSKIFHINKPNYIIINKKKQEIYCGSSWWCLTRDCIEYIYNIMKQANNPYETYFKTCLAPDEMYIQTIVFNSEYKNNAILYHGEYPGLKGLTPLHYIEYTDKIATYNENDFQKLLASNKMFCRKVQTGISDKLIEMINHYRTPKKL